MFRDEKNENIDTAYLFDIDETILISQTDSEGRKLNKIINPIMVCAIKLALAVPNSKVSFVTFRNGYTSFAEDLEKQFLSGRNLEEVTFASLIDGLGENGIDMDKIELVTRYVPILQNSARYVKNNIELQSALTALKKDFTLKSIMEREALWLKSVESSEDKLEAIKSLLKKEALPEAIQEFEKSPEGQDYTRKPVAEMSPDQIQATNSDKGQEFLYASPNAKKRVVIDDDKKYVTTRLELRQKQDGFVPLTFDKKNVKPFIESFIRQLPENLQSEASDKFRLAEMALSKTPMTIIANLRYASVRPPIPAKEVLNQKQTIN